MGVKLGKYLQISFPSIAELFAICFYMRYSEGYVILDMFKDACVSGQNI